MDNYCRGTRGRFHHGGFGRTSTRFNMDEGSFGRRHPDNSFNNENNMRNQNFPPMNDGYFKDNDFLRPSFQKNDCQAAGNFYPSSYSNKGGKMWPDSRERSTWNNFESNRVDERDGHFSQPNNLPPRPEESRDSWEGIKTFNAPKESLLDKDARIPPLEKYNREEEGVPMDLSRSKKSLQCQSCIMNFQTIEDFQEHANSMLHVNNVAKIANEMLLPKRPLIAEKPKEESILGDYHSFDIVKQIGFENRTPCNWKNRMTTIPSLMSQLNRRGSHYQSSGTSYKQTRSRFTPQSNTRPYKKPERDTNRPKHESRETKGSEKRITKPDSSSLPVGRDCKQMDDSSIFDDDSEMDIELGFKNEPTMTTTDQVLDPTIILKVTTSEASNTKVCSADTNKHQGDEDEEHPTGQEYVIAVTGFFCKLCNKFYNKEIMAKIDHCKSDVHKARYKEVMKEI